MFKSNVSCKRGKLVAKQKNQSKNVFFNKNVLGLNQKHLQVFQTFRLLKNTKETSCETQETWLKTSQFCFVFNVSPDLKMSRLNITLKLSNRQIIFVQTVNGKLNKYYLTTSVHLNEKFKPKSSMSLLHVYLCYTWMNALKSTLDSSKIETYAWKVWRNYNEGLMWF